MLWIIAIDLLSEAGVTLLLPSPEGVAPIFHRIILSTRGTCVLTLLADRIWLLLTQYSPKAAGLTYIRD